MLCSYQNQSLFYFYQNLPKSHKPARTAAAPGNAATLDPPPQMRPQLFQLLPSLGP